jgi:hypothetical protein
MANFLTTLLSNGNVKQGLEKGGQGISHAAIGLVEQFATRGLIGKVLPGVGMINPLLGIFTEPIVSALKFQINARLLQPIFGGGPTQALNMVDATGSSSDVTGIRQVVSNVRGFIPRFEYRSVGDASFKREAFDSLHNRGGTLSLTDDVKVAPHLTRSGHAAMGRGSLRKPLSRVSALGNEELPEAFLQQHRFLVFDFTPDPNSVFEWTDGGAYKSLAAGFSYCDSPSMTIRTETVKEGTWEFPREIPIGVEPGRLSLQKGIVRTTTSFYLWIEQFLRGNVTRRTLKILAYGNNLTRARNSMGGAWNMPEGNARVVYGEWTLYNCAPIHYKAGQGWDARTGEIQIAEMDIAFEWFEESSPVDIVGERSVPTSQ